jgi:hypothetical protein
MYLLCLSVFIPIPMVIDLLGILKTNQTWGSLIYFMLKASPSRTASSTELIRTRCVPTCGRLA